MSMHQKLQVGNQIVNGIDWEMTPDMSFGTFESWGGRERVRNNSERIHYFFIDAWGERAKLCLMERGVKHARVMAEIDAPQGLIDTCVARQGSSSRFEKSYAIDTALREWLIENLFGESGKDVLLVLEDEIIVEDMGEDLPKPGGQPDVQRCRLPQDAGIINDDQIEGVIKKWDFYESGINPDGEFENYLVDSGDPLTVIDEKTALMWQRTGLDIASVRTMQRNIKELNETGYAGHHDWRLPTMEEAMSLMEQPLNSKGVHLPLCFSKEQPFIIVAAQRLPGGYWFVDYKQGRAFWSSGTIPGGFGRLCRSLS